MGLFRRKQEDRSYHIKLKRTSYAKLGLISERLGTTEAATIDGIIDFALANFSTNSKAAGGNLDIASLVTGEASENTDVVSQLVAAFLPKLLAGGIGGPNAPGTASGDQPANANQGVDVQKALKDIGL